MAAPARIYRILRSILPWSAAMLCLLLLNDRLLRTAARNNPASRVNWIFLQPPTSYDVAILGSSLAKEDIDPNLLGSLTDRSIVQLAWGGRGVAEQALYWELFVKRHRCKTLLLELHPRGLERDALAHPLDEFRYVARINNPVVRRHLERQFGFCKTLSWQWIPMWPLAEFSTQIGWHDVLALRRGERFEPNQLSPNNRQDVAAAVLAQSRLDPLQSPGASDLSLQSIEQFNEILELCRKNQIEVIAFYPPQYGGSRLPSDFRALSVYAGLLDPATEIYQVGEAAYLQDSACFQDAHHLNETGRRQYTKGLAEQLSASGTAN